MLGKESQCIRKIVFFSEGLLQQQQKKELIQRIPMHIRPLWKPQRKYLLYFSSMLFILLLFPSHSKYNLGCWRSEVTYFATNSPRRNPKANQMSSPTQQEVKKQDHVSIVLQRWQLLALASRWECAALGVGCMVATRAGLRWNWDAV